MKCWPLHSKPDFGSSCYHKVFDYQSFEGHSRRAPSTRVIWGGLAKLNKQPHQKIVIFFGGRGIAVGWPLTSLVFATRSSTEEYVHRFQQQNWSTMLILLQQQNIGRIVWLFAIQNLLNQHVSTIHVTCTYLPFTRFMRFIDAIVDGNMINCAFWVRDCQAPCRQSDLRIERGSASVMLWEVMHSLCPWCCDHSYTVVYSVSPKNAYT